MDNEPSCASTRQKQHSSAKQVKTATLQEMDDWLGDCESWFPGTRGVGGWACRGASLRSAAAAAGDPSLGNVLWCLSDGEIIHCAQVELPSHHHRGCERK
ncbi:hypothetical protein AV530_002225 [Patagioenas fasciata monilis]|uniref:Uncharacterized protein n=1 Tax=Patagioenas fasciata monilis TaxID=372326 RepID=A0A1V4K5T4_PATFA|nr:hypothetical protein AV530_002225 [Patagioenas fasciata monilis]